jgi:membrane protein
MPNTRGRWQAAAVGGLVAGVLWYLNNSLSVLFVAQAARDRAIYSSLAAVPVFMVSVYLFWLILLFGAQVSYTFQNRRTYFASRQADRVHQDGREFVAMRIMIEAARAFLHQSTPPSISALSDRLQIPGQLICQTANTLLRTNLLVEVNQGDCGYFPARPLNLIRVADILQAMRRGVGTRLPTPPDGSRTVAETELARVAEAERQAGDRTLAELVDRVPPPDADPGPASESEKKRASLSV